MDTVTGLIIACLASIAYGAPSSQIFGRDVVNTYPYHASLAKKMDISDTILYVRFCGGAIINKRFVITTAQCLLPRISNPYQVYVAYGSKYYNESIVVRAATLIVHAGYNVKLHINDIGLIRVEADITFNENTQPIKLPTADRNYDFYPFVVTGWKTLWGSRHNFMQEVIVQGLTSDQCDMYTKIDIKDAHICTSSDEKEGICYGDEGNPLVADNVLIGLISFNIKCTDDEPTVSTKVFYYREWIKFYTGI